jgi:hypothetical protein
MSSAQVDLLTNSPERPAVAGLGVVAVGRLWDPIYGCQVEVKRPVVHAK